MQTIQPSSNYLFCKPDEAETKTQSGFILASSAAEKPKTALVINVGENVTYKPNNRIVYKAYATSEVKLNDQEYILIAQEDVLGEVVEVDG